MLCLGSVFQELGFGEFATGGCGNLMGSRAELSRGKKGGPPSGAYTLMIRVRNLMSKAQLGKLAKTKFAKAKHARAKFAKAKFAKAKCAEANFAEAELAKSKMAKAKLVKAK